MHKLILLILAATAMSACASRGDQGGWPSLACRPGETAERGPCDTNEDAANGNLPLQPIIAAPAPAALPLNTLADIDIALADIRADWTRQSARAEDAVAAAQGVTGGPIWGRAQIAISRLEAEFGRTAPLDTQLAAIAAPYRLRGLLPPKLIALDTRMRAFEAAHHQKFDDLRRRLAR